MSKKPLDRLCAYFVSFMCFVIINIIINILKQYLRIFTTKITKLKRTHQECRTEPAPVAQLLPAGGRARPGELGPTRGHACGRTGRGQKASSSVAAPKSFAHFSSA